MGDTGAMLLQAIVNDPEADDLRLIYADWLHDHGEPERAEFIRVQCRLADIDEADPARWELERREAELQGRHRRRWEEQAGLRAYHHLLHFYRRGFADDYFSMPCEQFLQIGADLAAKTPLRRLGLHGATAHLAALAGCSALARVRHLGVSGSWLRLPELTELLRSPHLGALTGLHLGCSDGADALATLVLAWPGCVRLKDLALYTTETPPSVVARLLAAPRLANLRQLHINDFDTGCVRELVRASAPPPLETITFGSRTEDTAGVRLLARWPGLRHVRALSVGVRTRGPEGDDCLAELAASPYRENLRTLGLFGGHLGSTLRALGRGADWSSLRTLSVTHTPIHAADLAELAAAPHWGALRHLDLGATGLEDNAVRQLAHAPTLRPVTLDLHENEFGTLGMAALAASPILERIQRLDLARAQLGNGGVESLARANLGQRVTSLNLYRCEIAAAGVRALAVAPWLATVQNLSLAYNPLREAGGIALASSPVLRCLLDLDLSASDIGDATARALARWPAAAALVRLTLLQNNLTDDGARALAASPHLAGLDSLNVWHNPISLAGLELLWARFGERVHPTRQQWEQEQQR